MEPDEQKPLCSGELDLLGTLTPPSKLPRPGEGPATFPTATLPYLFALSPAAVTLGGILQFRSAVAPENREAVLCSSETLAP